ncbi:MULTISPECIES: glycosyltransferase family 39 protein [unclassified Leptolyngbya]|uniref:ArnT family glycosyltransferase n=1 Tax=unclassified Leptolyngbya TaxID=2650499 RepID=UPI001689BC8F|nr:MULTISPECIES: glycosyltransferase family 39 protein [unclassified Leptolyngbya]MBD1912146.1 glycosyltransferase family 39 protein [Leptolyngbya sp. FACHB-8]MBD2155037.1 glycosyltransferase family 39 protein [Leptolyngbya sp. FACHB-16]
MRRIGKLNHILSDRGFGLDHYIALALLGAALVAFTFNLGGLALRDWDEGTVAQVAREIWRSTWQSPADEASQSLTWLFPTLGGEPYVNKPPLIHNLMAIAFQLGGINEFTARLPGALLTAVSVPVLYALGREVFRRRSAALMAALVYLTSLPVMRLGRLAMLDGAVLCFLLVMLWCTVRSRRDIRYSLGIGIGFGLISLTKGVLLGILLGAIALLFLAWDTPRLLRQRYLWLGLALGGLPVALWYGAQVWHYGTDFLGRNLVNQSLSRVWDSVEDNSGPPWYYLLELLKYGLPWLVFLPISLQKAWQNRDLGWAKLVLVWAGVYFVTISLMGTKLPWYILPLYPALALAIASHLADMWENGRHINERQYFLGHYSWSWFWVFMGLAALSLGAGLYLGFWQILPQPNVGWMCLVLAGTLFSTAILLARRSPRFMAILAWGTFLTLLLLMGSSHWVWELAEDYPVKPVATLIQNNTPPGERVHMSASYHRPSLDFYSDRQVIPANRKRLQQLWQSEPQVYLLLNRNTLKQWRPSPRPTVLGTAEGWTLVHHGNSQAQ